jgi:WD40 repeat protein
MRHYAVFLSYRHADNKEPGRQWATWLHQILENYEVPPDLIGTTNGRDETIPASLYPVFRDEEELPADADLTRNIRLALENSDLLVVICSPRAAKSRFVSEEIRYFKELGKANRILALIIDGEPNTTDDTAKQIAGLTIEQECLPEPLRRGVARSDGSIEWNAKTEPIAADARPNGRPTEGWTNAAAYREHLLRDGRLGKSDIDTEVRSYEERLELTKLKIVAGALGVPLGILTQRDKAMQLERTRKRARTLRRWLTAVAFLAMIAMAGGIFAWKKQREAAQERDAKEQARKEEEKQRELAQEQSEKRRQMLAEAARSDRVVAEEKLENDQSSDAFACLARSITYDATTTLAAEKAIGALNNWNVALLNTFCDVGDPIYSSEFSPDGRLILTSSPAHPAQVWDARTGKLVSNPGGDKSEDEQNTFRFAHFSPDGKHIAAWIDEHTAGLWETATGKLLTHLRGLNLTSFQSPVEFSPDRKHMAADTAGNTVSVWETDTGKLVVVLKAHVAEVFEEFDPSGQRIITSSNDRAVRVWDTLSGEPSLVLTGHEGAVNSARFSPDGRIIMTVTEKMVRLWRADTGKLISTFSNQRFARFSPDGASIATASDNGTVRLWDAKTGKLVRVLMDSSGKPSDTASAGTTATLEFSPNGQHILSGLNDNAVRVWDFNTGEVVATLNDQQLAEFSPDGQSIATASGSKFSTDTNVRIWDVKTGELRLIAQGVESPVHDLRFSADARRIVVSSDDKIARVWDTKSRGLVLILRGHEKEVFAAAFSPDGNRAVTGSNDETVRVWDASSAAVLMTLNAEGKGFVERAEFSPDGKIILAVSSPRTNDGRIDYTTSLWGSNTGKLLWAFRTSPPKGQLTAVFSPNSQLLAIDDRENVALWGISTGKVLRLFPGQVRPDFGPSGQSFVTVSKDNTAATLWQTQTGQQLLKIDAPGDENSEFIGALLSPDEKSILTTSFNGLNSWSSKNGAHIKTFPADAGNAEFSSNGRYILTTFAGHHSKVNVLDVESAKLLFTLTDQEGASFSPDGSRVVSEDLKQSAEIRETETGKLVFTIRGNEGHLTNVRFNREGTRLVSIGDEVKTARISTVLSPTAGPPPSWFTDFLIYLGQRRFNSAGELVSIAPGDLLAIRDRLRTVVEGSKGQDTQYLRVLRHFVEE